MSYVIPRTREQAIEIHNDLISRPIIFIDKYDMFIGALCEYSDEEFGQQTSEIEDVLACGLCENQTGIKVCNIDCTTVTRRIFSKCWNE